MLLKQIGFLHSKYFFQILSIKNIMFFVNNNLLIIILFVSLNEDIYQITCYFIPIFSLKFFTKSVCKIAFVILSNMSSFFSLEPTVAETMINYKIAITPKNTFFALMLSLSKKNRLFCQNFWFVLMFFLEINHFDKIFSFLVSCINFQLFHLCEKEKSPVYSSLF